MLSKEELSKYGTNTLTDVFLDRVFQECLTYDGEMVKLVVIARVGLRLRRHGTPINLMNNQKQLRETLLYHWGEI